MHAKYDQRHLKIESSLQKDLAHLLAEIKHNRREIQERPGEKQQHVQQTQESEKHIGPSNPVNRQVNIYTRALRRQYTSVSIQSTSTRTLYTLNKPIPLVFCKRNMSSAPERRTLLLTESDGSSSLAALTMREIEQCYILCILRSGASTTQKHTQAYIDKNSQIMPILEESPALFVRTSTSVSTIWKIVEILAIIQPLLRIHGLSKQKVDDNE
jgi:hypothetical protein